MRLVTKLLGVLSALVVSTGGAAFADTYTVTNTADSGAGSLRQAILDANAHPNSGGPDVISFAIPGGGVKTISPTSGLPVITDPVMIDGYTQPGSSPNTNATGGLNTVLTIELDGTNAGNVNGLTIAAGGCTVRGLAVNAFARQGIELQGAGNVVAGSFVGTNVTGTAKQQNGLSGIFVGSANNVIGGTTPAARNLSSGNIFHDVEINGAAANGNQVQGNLLGTNAAGTSSLTGTTSFGVFITAGAKENVIGGATPAARNLISGNVLTGVLIRDSSDNRIEGNYIGTDINGTAALGNTGSGVGIENSTGNIVGGTQAGVGNLISGNLSRGVNIFSGSTGNLVQGNYIGTDVTGTVAIANAGPGVRLLDAGQNTIGGTDAGQGNVISGNGQDGIRVQGATSADNRISQNLIGRNAANNGPLGNSGHGVSLQSSGPNVIGGGFNPNNANTIAHNGGDGVTVVFGSGPCIKKGIISNSIFSNGGLGIDLEDDGVTQNDAGDGDTGANTLQNFPVLTSASLSGGSITIEGSFNSTPNKSFHLEFFASAAADPSGYGEGQTFLGFKDVTTDGSGNVASLNVVLSVLPPAGQTIITATATDNEELANTSEFSNAVQIIGTPGNLLNIATRLRVQDGENVLIGGMIITGSDPKKVIIRAIGPSLAQFFSGALANPTLELFQGNTLLASNNDWKEGGNQGVVEATGIPPSNDLESAIVQTLAPGAYTAVMRGNGGGTGIGLVEVYDLDQAANSRLGNIATRGFVETDNNVMIGGIIIGGNGGGNTQVVVRGIGPSLSAFGISGALQDPVLELKDANGATLNSNDDWMQGQAAEIQQLGLAPGDSRESALLGSLPNGNYTGIVRGKNNTTGVGLVEVYHVD